MSKYDEENIVERLRNETTKKKAFEEIVNKHSRTLYWQIRHIIINHDDTDDVLQNTLLKAWKSIDSFAGDAKISTWLYRIAYNESLNFIKQRKETASCSADTDGDEQTAGSAMQIAGEDYIDGDKVQMMLQEAIAQLPAKQKAVFTMKYFNEMKYEEMSEVTQTSVGALKASYHIAVEKITAYIKTHTL